MVVLLNFFTFPFQLPNENDRLLDSTRVSSRSIGQVVDSTCVHILLWGNFSKLVSMQKENSLSLLRGLRRFSKCSTQQFGGLLNTINRVRVGQTWRTLLYMEKLYYLEKLYGEIVLSGLIPITIF